MKHAKFILPAIVISQFCCTSLWFAGNAVINDLVLNYELSPSALGHLTSAVQFGFIIGTLLFAILTIADRFSPSKVFLISALLGSLFNLGIIWEDNSLMSLLSLRFLTGFFLAGIYPVGMKIAADYYEKGLGKSLGFLVAALVVGTAFPHLLKGITDTFPWKSVLLATSSLAVLGGLLMFILVPDGPYRKPSQRINPTAFLSVFKNREFRSVAFGYFGHMWELYAFWAFVPIMLKKYSVEHSQALFNIPVLSFIVIGVGGLACIGAAYMAQSVGTKRTAFTALFLSCACCLMSPLLFASASEGLFIGFLIFWGMVVIADSPLLSTLVAQNAPAEIKGTALTIVNCIGFSITIISIQFISSMIALTASNSIYIILAIGPILGLFALRKKHKVTVPNGEHSSKKSNF
ncbi:MFS transporter [Subsaximicrobium wynnwilliamsii]|uniref:MFS transporter n=1 Tax=Subsaximicrobium wynnwilliamsii TaxID=291179 RepID=A0A5C6ZG22_9FLAO|nr:MFS transporter [Subsaximicrobium wynnwilliamsii]TXD82898.1 MFS transporter [Subsaximicrobium wynnwilliamsii]TXD88620.1 MFS transporter [Subsaximicrobium wynnwilliamsii]TXE02712.1 MFS transporter [Subsaximicrobium wynnwilliamsii]